MAENHKIKLSKMQETLIEKLGIANEKGGLQPAPARVLALLLVSDVTELTFDEIHETLNMSKSAASNAINLLLTTNKIDYMTKMGDRKRYFSSKVMYWQDNLKAELTNLNLVADLLKEVHSQRPKSTIDFNKKLKDVIEFIEFLHSEIPTIYEKWEKKKK